jgi:beta-lactamase superfamily II metal-dependent hydrolase
MSSNEPRRIRDQTRPGGSLAVVVARPSTEVIAPPPGEELFSETNDNSVVILLTCGMARIFLAGDAEAREEYIALTTIRGLKRSSTFRNYKTA